MGFVVTARETPLYGLFRISRQSLEEDFSETGLPILWPSRKLSLRLTEDYFLGVHRHVVAHLPRALPKVVVHLRSSQIARRSLFGTAGRGHGITRANSRGGVEDS